jgi:hypothetical protein
MTNGDRHSGQLFYETGTSVGVVANGQKRMYPVRDIAVILYTAGDPSREELLQLPASGNPPELERHTLVLRDGRVLKGKVYHWESDAVIFDTTAGRGTYHANDVARLYLNGPPARNVYNNILNPSGATNNPPPAGRGRGRGPWGDPQAQVRVEANRAWTDTGLVVNAGERISFNVDGTVTFGTGANMTAGPDGNKEMPPNSRFAVPNMAVGGLIGRISNGRPFAIGSARNLDMPDGGRLFLGVNDDHFQDNSDGFNVEIYRR